MHRGRPLNKSLDVIEAAVTYQEWLLKMAANLERSAQTPTRPEAGFVVVDGILPRGGGPEWDKLHIALSFWDGWIDASNHQWRHYEPIAEADWPRLALEIASALRAGREIENPIILSKFDHRPEGAK